MLGGRCGRWNASKNELRTFVEKTTNLIMQGIHLLEIDLFPPSKRDPQGDPQGELG
jgi:hypothetical protein